MNYKELDKEQMVKLLEEKDFIIDKLQKEREQLSYFANIDSMTGVFNRRYGMEMLNKLVEISKEKGSHTTVCFIDVDKLKTVNDSFGHGEGDKLLIEISSVLKYSIRKQDIVFRLGGDEFIIIFPHATLEQAKAIENRIWENIEKINHSNKFKYKLQISSGFCEYCDGDINSIEELIRKADTNMYKRKSERQIML